MVKCHIFGKRQLRTHIPNVIYQLKGFDWDIAYIISAKTKEITDWIEKCPKYVISRVYWSIPLNYSLIYRSQYVVSCQMLTWY